MPSALKILGPNGKPYQNGQANGAPASRHRIVRAKYDAAQTVEDTRKHWANADSLSARSANSADVRQKLRDRARYESANNSYCRGIVLTIANDTIGTGPRLQLLTQDAEVNRRIEQAFATWSDAVRLAEKLRTLCQARVVDGEAFALFTTNPAIPGDVQLDIRPIEADMVTTPTFNPLNSNAIDGIVFDDAGNPVQYHVLREHPGDIGIFSQFFAEFDQVPARLVMHWFRADRSGQVRGIPEITPALDLFAQLRRYTLAVLAAAETAADFSAVLESAGPLDPDEDDSEPYETFEIEKRVMATVPAGWKMNQFKAEQPTTSYPDFKHEILNEIARCLNMPFNIAAGNSSAYNYSSGRLDHQTYYKSLKVDQSHVELAVLDRVLVAWLDEAARTTDLLPGGTDPLGGWPHKWSWDGAEHVDPLKEAKGQEIRLNSYTTTLAAEYAKQNKDWEVEVNQIAREFALKAKLGLPLNPGAMAPATFPVDDTGDVAEAMSALMAAFKRDGVVSTLKGFHHAVADTT